MVSVPRAVIAPFLYTRLDVQSCSFGLRANLSITSFVCTFVCDRITLSARLVVIARASLVAVAARLSLHVRTCRVNLGVKR